VTRSTNAVIERLAAPSFHEGSALVRAAVCISAARLDWVCAKLMLHSSVSSATRFGASWFGSPTASRGAHR
jgi:hypothetical protein